MKITILGAGKLGSNIAQALLTANHDITIVDKNPEVIDRLGSRLDLQCVNVNAKDIESLKELKVDKSDVVIACTDEDDKNLVLATFAKALGVKRCIARLSSPEYVEELKFIKRAMKIDHLLNPDYTCAVEIYKHIIRHNSFADGFEMVNRVAVLKFTAKNLAGLSGGCVKEKASMLSGLLLAAISRNGKVIIPGGNTEILEDDVVYAIGSRSDATSLRKQLAREKSEKRLSHVMIAGGGKTGVCLARLLLEDGIDVKIIESNHDRCKYLASRFENASIIYGDATDQDLLQEEDFSQMDAFIACTDYDEVNLLLALSANKQNIPNVVAKMSHRSYGPIMETLGDTMTINPVELCTANVIRYINDDKNVVFSRLIQGQAEFTDIIVEPGMPIVAEKLSQLKLSEGILIGAIVRGDELIIPNGSTEICVGDKLTILSLLSRVPDIEKLLRKGNVGEF